MIIIDDALPAIHFYNFFFVIFSFFFCLFTSIGSVMQVQKERSIEGIKKIFFFLLTSCWKSIFILDSIY